MAGIDLERIEAERRRIIENFLVAEDKRPRPSARGIHHVALLASNVEETVRFFQGVLEFPLIEIFENRDYQGSNHFFFDLGHGNSLAFFDFPGLDLGPYAEVLGGLHHIAISVEAERWKRLRANLEGAGIEYAIHSEVSMYFRDPNGARIELIADPLGEMYGTKLMSWQD
jgi:catechol 2,3-dioxygenase-like lactoylglutathione lyase family enzyme